MSHQGLIRADLKMGKAEFAFLVFQNAFDGPTPEADMQPGFEPVFERVANEEEFLFFGVQRIVSANEVIAAKHLAVAVKPKGG